SGGIDGQDAGIHSVKNSAGLHRQARSPVDANQNRQSDVHPSSSRSAPGAVRRVMPPWTRPGRGLAGSLILFFDSILCASFLCASWNGGDAALRQPNCGATPTEPSPLGRPWTNTVEAVFHALDRCCRVQLQTDDIGPCLLDPPKRPSCGCSQDALPLIS